MMLSIVLDLDDTLYLERDYVASGFAALSQWVSAQFGVDGFGETAWLLWEGGQRKQTFDSALQASGIHPDAAIITRMIDIYRTHAPAIALQPDAAQFLSRGSDVRFALVTDGPACSQRAKIAALDLAAFGVEPLICTDEWGRAFWKPHRRAFETIADVHHTSDHFVYVADNPAKDFLAPRALGWRTVQIDRAGAIHSRQPPSESHRADLQIESFADLTDGALECLLGHERKEISG